MCPPRLACRRDFRHHSALKFSSRDTSMTVNSCGSIGSVVVQRMNCVDDLLALTPAIAGSDSDSEGPSAGPELRTEDTAAARHSRTHASSASAPRPVPPSTPRSGQPRRVVGRLGSSADGQGLRVQRNWKFGLIAPQGRILSRPPSKHLCGEERCRSPSCDSLASISSASSLDPLMPVTLPPLPPDTSRSRRSSRSIALELTASAVGLHGK